MAGTSQDVRRAGTAILVLGLVMATAAFLLPRLLALEPRGSSSTPLAGPSASGDAAASDVFFPTLPTNKGIPDWGAGGTLIEDEGCIFLWKKGVWKSLVLWPPGWSIERTADSVLQILDAGGNPVVDVGDEATLHGGGYAYEPQYVEEMIGQPFPRRCRAQDYFVTSGQLLGPGAGSSTESA